MLAWIHWFVIIYVIAVFARMDQSPWIVLLLIPPLIYFVRTHRMPLWLVFSLLLCFIFFYNQTPSTDRQNLDSSHKSMIQGDIISEVNKTDTYVSFLLKEYRSTNKVKVQLFHQNERAEDLFIQKLNRGSRCQLVGTFQEMITATNPGQFDYQHYLHNQGISSQFLINDSTASNCSESSFYQMLYNARNQLLEHLGGYVNPFTFSWINALLFGNKDLLSDETITLFQDWNLSHLLAISGLHVGLLMTCLYFFGLYIVKLSVERMQLILFLFLPIYPLLSGAAPSVWRASLLALFLLVLRKLKIKLPTTSILSIVFFVMVLTNPYHVYSIAFQFSFIVTYAILFSRKLLSGDIGFVWISLRISFISLMVLLPIQIQLFYQFQPLSVLVNLIVVPYFTLFVLPFLLLICFSAMIPSFLPIWSHVFQFIHSHFLTLMRLIDEAISWSWTIGQIPNPLIIGYYICLLLFLLYFEQGKQIRAFSYGLGLAVCLVLASILPYLNPYGSITTLDIGQGDAIVIEYPYRRGVVIIDAGGKLKKHFTEPSSDVYDQIIDAFLRYRGISAVDAMILSHADHDHIGSVPYILDDYQVDYLITSPYFDQNLLKQYREKNKHFQHIEGEEGNKLRIKDHIFHVLHPSLDNGDKNENSLVLYSKFGEFNWLFTGDIGEKSEQYLASNYPSLPVDVLKVAHHGSHTSSSIPFIEQIQPEVGIISVGRNNGYGHPHPKVLRTLKRRKVRVFRTDRMGAITFQYDGTISTFLPYDNVKSKR
ncbi:DNA internalization-related competence protein ComEC/Rec2 [Gracilibacillus dipsosauri]|uniref:DNA internalization-related competence protein ComEC/Rec2 n=1 Tax=Gracilibacillus dipsosauri TaxID=178340 RepID=A0A317KY45_9BACI|nr:DNA internalization-related competence protein ComEC/Rec2 [Gracilibacillus dipsosauri]PWU68462.1 DNA internalization-related competence protein ComEC/Rec2 [Gracilibacillus dipsosauri]